MWISGAVLVIGIAAFLFVFLSRGTGSGQASSAQLSTVSSPPASTAQAAPKKVAPSAAALKVARTFLETAVLRKNLDVAYGLVGPDLKGGMSLAQWEKGNIPVAVYPARDAKTAKFVVESSHPNQLMLQVGLHPRKGSGVKPLTFAVGLERVGGKNGKPAHWLVNYFMAKYAIAVRANPNN